MTLPTLRRQGGLMELRTPLTERNNRQNQLSHLYGTRNSTRAKGKSHSSLASVNHCFNTRSATRNRGKADTEQSSKEKENTTTNSGGNLSQLTRSKRKTEPACLSTDQKRNCTSGQDGTLARLPPLVPDAGKNIPSLEVIQVLESPVHQNTDSQLPSLPKNATEKSQVLESVDHNQHMNKDLDSRSPPVEEDPAVKSDCKSPVELLNNAYDKLYKKYWDLKARRFDALEKAFEDQDSRMTTFIKAAEARVECLEKENRSLRSQLGEAKIADIINRFRILERDYADSRNEVVLEQAKNLELEHRVKFLEKLQMKQNAVPGNQHAEECTKGSEIGAIEEVEGSDSKLKLLQHLMENLVGMQLEFVCSHDEPSSSSSSSSIQFLHRPTGLCFRLRLHCPYENSSEEELAYELVSLGTLCRKATSWMKEEEIIFGMSQLQFFFKKLLQVANGSST